MLVTVLMLHSLPFCSDFSITFFMTKFDTETTVKILGGGGCLTFYPGVYIVYVKQQSMIFN